MFALVCGGGDGYRAVDSALDDDESADMPMPWPMLDLG